MIREIILSTIRTDAGTQARVAMDERYIDELIEGVQAGATLPPVLIYHDGDECWLADGFHRLAAAKRMGRQSIAADMKKGTQADAIWASASSNATHGKRREPQDVLKAIKLAIGVKPTATDKEIADHVSTTVQKVSGVRRGLAVEAEKPVVKPPPPQNEGKRVIPPPPPPRSRIAAPAKPEVPSDMLDATGKLIPAHLQSLFHREHEIHGLLAELKRVKHTLKDAQSKADPLFAEIDYQTVFNALDTALNGVNASVPYAVCRFCHGDTTPTCKACSYRGVMGQYRYNTLVPASMKG